MDCPGKSSAKWWTNKSPPNFSFHRLAQHIISHYHLPQQKTPIPRLAFCVAFTIAGSLCRMLINSIYAITHQRWVSKYTVGDCWCCFCHTVTHTRARTQSSARVNIDGVHKWVVHEPKLVVQNPIVSASPSAAFLLITSECRTPGVKSLCALPSTITRMASIWQYWRCELNVQICFD